MDIISIIDRMESLMNTSKSVPVSGNIIVDKHKVMELVDQLRLSIPQEIRAAEEVLGSKDEIVNQAMVEARRTRVQADDEYRTRMNDNEILAKAQARAEETIREAEQRSAKLPEAIRRRSQVSPSRCRRLCFAQSAGPGAGN